MEYFNRHLQHSEIEPPVPWYWKLYFWSLGITDWSGPLYHDALFEESSLTVRCPPLRGRRFHFLTATLIHIAVIFWSTFTAWWHVDCFYFSTTDALFLVSFLVFYWPTVVAAPVICLIASFKRMLSSRRLSAESEQPITWITLFAWKYAYQGLRARTFGAKISVETATLVMFYMLLVINTLLELFYFTNQPTNCQTWTGFSCLLNHMFNLFFYANFCYYLYLQRKALGVKSGDVIASIEKSFPDHRKCSTRVKDFFREYFQLRRFLFPCLNVILFSTAFGTTFVMTWWLNRPTGGSAAPTIPTPERDTLFCSKTCQKVYIDQAQESGLYIAKVMTQKIMMALLALVVVGGIDLKYQWNRFKMKMYLVTECNEHRRSWKRLSDLVERIHPDTSTDVIASFIIPLLGVVAGFLSGEQVDS